MESVGLHMDWVWKCAVIIFFSRPEPKRHRACLAYGVVLAVIGRCGLVARLEVGHTG